MLSDDLNSLMELLHKNTDLDRGYTFTLTGTSTIALMRQLQAMHEQAIELEKCAIPDRMTVSGVGQDGNVVRIDHWKSKHA